MKHTLSILFTTLVFISCEKNSTDTMLLQPGPDEGFDAIVWNIAPDQTYANFPEFNSLAWTYETAPCYMRGYIKFDLSGISTDRTIKNAELHLFGIQSEAHGSHQSLTGPNYSVLCRITESWDDETLTWSNMPTFDDDDATLLDSCNSIQDFVIDVTDHVADMVQNPEENFGWVLKQENEAFYRKMIFASSNYENEALRPKLVIEME